jgi:uncharacterized protein (DUF433 family)
VKKPSRILIDDKIHFGKPVIKGTRVPVELVIGKLAGGMTFEEVQREYRISRNDLLAALDADLSGNLVIIEPGKIRIRRHK